MEESAILQFAPFSSAVEAGFWHSFTQLKMDVLQLSEEPVAVAGSYVNSDPAGLPARLNVEYDALSSQKQSPAWSCGAVGTLINTNTIEEFRNRSKQEVLREAGARLWEAITTDTALHNPSLLASFLMFTFSDLKKYHYYYWFAFPSFTLPKPFPLLHQPQPLPSVFSHDQMCSLLSAYTSLGPEVHRGFFCLTVQGEQCSLHPLRDYPNLRAAAPDSRVYLGLSDPSTMAVNPGWPLRNLLTLVTLKWAREWDEHRVVCLRVRTRSGHQEASHSVVVGVKLGELGRLVEAGVVPPVLGWEKNERGKMGPRMLNLSASMDPTRLAESAVDLNLKLMRWRVAPQLDLGAVQTTRCLLLGAGTLGCAVARCLLGWGVRHLTLVDNSKVSYSNPVRQNLFTFKDCLNGGKPKATAAAEALRDIYPKVDCKGVVLSIPMPGHPVGDSLMEQVRQEVGQLEALVQEHDAIFLLMDSRESRWLPTLLGAAKHKIVMTAALGFDSFLVMRHGFRSSDPHPSQPPEPSTLHHLIPGHRLGCYYCNDVVAPGDSMGDRTLDQQCTVTRPGMSYLAAAHVVELLVSLLQHPDRGLAEASISDQAEAREGVLGPVPHSLRGFLGRYQLLTPATTAFDQCPGCSHKVISAYREEGFAFLLKVFNCPTYLEEVSGLSSLQQCIDDSQIWELSDQEDDSADSS